MSEGKYLIGESLREKLKSTIAKVDSIPFGGPVRRIPIVFDDSPAFTKTATRLAAFSISDGPWIKGASRPVEFYRVDENGITPSGTTVTAGNVSVDFMPMSFSRGGTTDGPTPSMAWAIVAKDQNGNYLAVEAEPSPLVRLATREIADWQIRETKYVQPTGTTSAMQAAPAINLLGSYSELDAPLGVVYAKSPIDSNGNTANVVIGPPPIPMHQALYTASGSWPKGESRDVVAFPSEGTTTPRTVNVTNPLFDSITPSETPLVIGKFGTAYSVIAGPSAPGVMLATRDATNQPWVRGSQRTVMVTGSTSTVSVYSAFDDYLQLDLTAGMAYASSFYAPAGGTANVVIGPPPIPMHNVTYTAGGAWVRGESKTVVVPPSGGVTQTRTVTANNPYFDTIDEGDQPLAIGKFGTAYSVIAGAGTDTASVKFADRTDSGQWERGSSRAVKIQGTTNEVQAVNLVGHYEAFDGRGPSGMPGLLVAKGKAVGDASGTAFYVISPPPITFRTGSFTGQWGKGSSKSITLSSSPTGTISVINNFGTVGSTASGSRSCAMSKEGSQWYLIAAEC